MVKSPVRKTGELRSKSQLRHKFLSIFRPIVYMNINKLYDIFNVNTLHVFNEGDISDTAHIQSVVHFFLH